MPPDRFAAALVYTVANQLEILLFGYFVLQDLPADVLRVVRIVIALTIVLAALPALWELRQRSGFGRPGGSLTSRLVFFGPVWWLINVPPLAVTYATSRHLYLPTVGLAVVVGIAFDAVCRRAGVYQKVARPVLAAPASRRASSAYSDRSANGPPRQVSPGKWLRTCTPRPAPPRPGTLIVVGAARTAELSPPPHSLGHSRTSVPRPANPGSGRGQARTSTSHRSFRTRSAVESASLRHC